MYTEVGGSNAQIVKAREGTPEWPELEIYCKIKMWNT